MTEADKVKTALEAIRAAVADDAERTAADGRSVSAIDERQQALDIFSL